MHQTWVKIFYSVSPFLQAVKVFGIFRWWKLSCANPETSTGKKIMLLCIDDTCSFWQRVCICSLWEQRRSAGIIVTHWFLYLWMPTSEMSHPCSTLFLQPWKLSVSLKPVAWIINFWIALFSNQRMEQNSKIFF